MKHALVIEDNLLIAEMIRDYLRESGYSSVDLAQTEAEAVRLAELHCPDLITADAKLEQGSGVQAIRNICRDVAISVIFITADSNDVRDSLPNAHLLLKPFSEQALSRAIAAAEQAPQTFA